MRQWGTGEQVTGEEEDEQVTGEEEQVTGEEEGEQVR